MSSFFAIPARASLGRDNDPLGKLANFCLDAVSTQASLIMVHESGSREAHSDATPRQRHFRRRGQPTAPQTSAPALARLRFVFPCGLDSASLSLFCFDKGLALGLYKELDCRFADAKEIIAG